MYPSKKGTFFMQIKRSELKRSGQVRRRTGAVKYAGKKGPVDLFYDAARQFRHWLQKASFFEWCFSILHFVRLYILNNYYIIALGKGIKQSGWPQSQQTTYVCCILRGGGSMVSTYECLSLMIAFAILIIEIIRNNDNKPKK